MLTDRISLMYRIGPCCRKDMTGEQLAAALKLTRDEAQPGYIPLAKPISFEARTNNAEAQAIADGPPTCARHGGVLKKCPQCRQEEDLAWCVRQIIEAVQHERWVLREARHAAAMAEKARAACQPHQLAMDSR
jgi:hypothetical protein